MASRFVALIWLLAVALVVSDSIAQPPSPREPLTRFQDAMALIAQGESALQKLESGVLPSDRLDEARQTLRHAASLLESLDKDLQAQLVLRRRSTAQSDRLSADELLWLSENTRYQLARANRCRGMLFPAGSEDRLSLLLAAVGNLSRLLPQVPENEPLHASIQLDLAECHRLLGKYDEAAELATAIERDKAAPELRLHARAELIRVAIARPNFADLTRLLAPAPATDGQSSADLDFARLEALLALSTAARDSVTTSVAVAEKFEHQAIDQVSLIERTHGAVWGQRASQLLIRTLPLHAVHSTELLSRAADTLYLKGESEQAIAAYDNAAAQAKVKGDKQQAFELAYKAALIEQRRERRIAAADRLQRLAMSSPNHPQASQAHLLAAWNLAQESSTNESMRKQCEQILAEHLAQWPNAESADQARFWLGKLKEQQSDWPAAIENYQRIGPQSAHYAAATAALDRCWRAELAALKASDAISALGRDKEALTRFIQLARQNPDDAALQRGYGRLLIASSEPESLRQALDHWRWVASRTPPRTDDWYEAKHSVALAQFKLGDRASAATLLRFLLETPPGLNGSPWEAKYADLLRKCEQ